MMVEDIIVEELVVEEDRPAHIAKHQVKIEEVLEVINGDYLYIQAKLERWRLIGKTGKGRFLTIVVGARKKKNVYGLVTARSSKKQEISLYNEYMTQKGGGNND